MRKLFFVEMYVYEPSCLLRQFLRNNSNMSGDKNRISSTPRCWSMLVFKGVATCISHLCGRANCCFCFFVVRGVFCFIMFYHVYHHYLPLDLSLILWTTKKIVQKCIIQMNSTHALIYPVYNRSFPIFFPISPHMFPRFSHIRPAKTPKPQPPLAVTCHFHL